ncbi:MAG: ABC transporter substrate-binding protein [Rhodospirillaceae bacterium]|nr:ABC transporter substrate-binding protein [Rhodospirillaceae bacterium]
MASIRHRFAVLATVLLVVLCGAGAPQAAQTLRVGMTTLPPSLFNPYATTGLPYVYVWSAVFDGLTYIDEQGEVKPWLATGWENLDPLTWRITLRDDVVFSDGTPMMSDAVVAVGEFLTSPAATKEVVARMMSFIDTVRAVDTHTVEIVTKAPTPTLPRFLPQFYVVQPEHFRRLGLEGFARDPIATGPFAVERIAANKVTFRAHDRAWRPPRVARLEIITSPDASARRMAVEAGQIDLALGIGPDEVHAIEAIGGTGFSWRDAGIWAYQFNGNRDGQYQFAPFRDIRVREALNLAVDRQAIIDTLLDGRSVPATHPAPEGVYGFDPDLPPIPYDPDKARRLLAEAGFGNGFAFTAEATVGGGANDGAIHQTVAQYLAAIGVRMNIQVITPNQLIRNVVEGTWTADAFGLHYNFEPTADVLRALDTASCLWHSPWYCNAAVMPDIRAAQVTFDPAQGLAARRRIMAAYRWDWPGIYMHQAVRFAAARKGVSGLKVVNNFIQYDLLDMK